MKPARRSSIDILMNFENALKPKTVVPIKRIPCSSEFPPFEVGLTAALRRAFTAPPVEDVDEFDALLAKLR
jgi:hypothetical protein